MRKFTNILIVGLLLLLAQAAIQAQTINGTISGTVVDQQGAVVVGATVTVKNPETGFKRTMITNDDGSFKVTALPVANYIVSVEKSGFKTSVNNSVGASVGGDTGIRVTLETGSIEAIVEVTSSGDVLDTTAGQVSKTVSQKQILELPGRNSLNGLALLNPGVLPNQNGRPGSGFAVNGNRTRSNNFTIDGANNNDQSLSIPRQNLPSEALEEFTIVTNTPKAEFGRNAGSYVNQITRSGTNSFTGTGFYTWGGNGLDALTTSQERSFNANVATLGKAAALRNARSVTVDNTYGFTLGGPLPNFGFGEGTKFGLLKDHTFFFTSIDFNDFRTTVSSAARVAISPLGRARLQYPGRVGVVPSALNYALTNFPAANDPTSQGSLTLTGTTALAACPVADPTSCNVIPLEVFNRARSGGIPYGTNFNRYLFKINTRLFKNDNLSFRYLYDESMDPGSPTSIVGQEVGQSVMNDSFTVNDTISLTSRWLNEARFTISRRNISFPNNLGIAFSVTGVGGALSLGNSNFPQYRNDKVYEFTDNVSFTPANHSFKMGYSVLIYNLASFFAPNFNGTVSYPSLTNFLTDTSASIQRYAGDGLTDATTYENSMFFQDDWRVNQDLNVNLGIRYEYVTTPYGFFSNAKPDANNFGPRLGVAWNPKNMFGGRMVLRGGFGISYDQVFQNVLLNNSRNYPRGVNIALTNQNGIAPYITLPPAPTIRNCWLFVVTNDTRVRQPMSKRWTEVRLQYRLRGWCQGQATLEPKVKI